MSLFHTLEWRQVYLYSTVLTQRWFKVLYITTKYLQTLQIKMQYSIAEMNLIKHTHNVCCEVMGNNDKYQIHEVCPKPCPCTLRSLCFSVYNKTKEHWKYLDWEFQTAKIIQCKIKDTKCMCHVSVNKIVLQLFPEEGKIKWSIPYFATW